MQRFPLLKSWIIGVCFAVGTLLSGCTAVRFAYSQGPELSYWWLDGYADFSEAQIPKVRDTLEAWFRWHRQTQLDDYAQFLVRLQGHAAGPVTPELVCRSYQEALSRVDPMLDKALPMAVDLVRSLTPAQVQHIERKYAKVNREFRNDFLQPDPTERFEASVKRALDRAEMFYGSLDEAQLEALRRGIAASPFNPELWLEERMLRQQEALAMLRRIANDKAISPDQTLASLRVVVAHVQRSPRPHYLEYQQKLLAYNCKLAAQLHNSASREQRASAVKRFKGWEEDARSLAADGRKAP
ncbi:DUF6279 family lipoprotein [Piscinibacter gummiphilus]|uniref:DUF6279 family lipoprotein n=1 Tax=Piscinibacter gummiphilus TaxID=946333 RepID=A0ABZ0CXD8_9BURK|nr:DUF6279 family lipoprotein [Piscinibacter gummiphilus]WOB07826.1 DUF6279 family lipoprotein [Piscinibacter gummiphilus]